MKHYEERPYDFYHGAPVYLLNPIETENAVTETESVMDRLLFDKPITVCTFDLYTNLNSSCSLTALIYTECIIMNESKTSRLKSNGYCMFQHFFSSSLKPNIWLWSVFKTKRLKTLIE